MRTVFALCLLLAVRPLQAQEQPTGDARPVELSVHRADLRQIEFDTQTGALSFSVGGRRYVLAGRAESAGGYEAVAAAKLGLLSELRRCDQIAMSVAYNGSDPKMGCIVTMVLKYDSAKP